MGPVLDQIVREMNAGKVKENVLLVLIQPPMPLNSQFFSLDAMYLQDNFVPSYFRHLLGIVSFLIPLVSKHFAHGNIVSAIGVLAIYIKLST